MGRVRVKEWEGKVETPHHISLHMVNKLFSGIHPTSASRVLDPGCGRGVFISTIIEWCRSNGCSIPEIIGVELDSTLAHEAREAFAGMSNIRIIEGDFLTMSDEVLGMFDYIIGNPPYISYEKIDPVLRSTYKRMFKVATGRFDIYMLFFEKALRLLKEGGRLVFITPEKYTYVLFARNLRKLLSKYLVEEVELLREDTFSGVLAYPAITVVRKVPAESRARTLVKLRDGSVFNVALPRDGSPWLAEALRTRLPKTYERGPKLRDISLRISPGVATGRDDVFVIPKKLLPKELEKFAYPTIGGDELSFFKPGESIDYNKLNYVMLVPYDRSGRLLSKDHAKPLIEYLSKYRPTLESRYVVRVRGKEWYAFHEDPPLMDILRPKILFPDIAREPSFYVDEEGLIIPRHSVYYLVPKTSVNMSRFVEYLNSNYVKEWLKAHCQRAANGYLRLQTHVVRNLPIPKDLLYGLRLLTF